MNKLEAIESMSAVAEILESLKSPYAKDIKKVINTFLYDQHSEKLREIIEHNGPFVQVLVAIEEFSELTKELLKHVNREVENLPQIAEEMADVTIMMRQLSIIFGNASDVEAAVEKKMKELPKKKVKKDEKK